MKNIPSKKLRIDVKNQKLKSVNDEEKVLKPGPASRRKLAISAAKSPSPRSPLRSRIIKAEPTKNKDDVKENFLQNPLFNSQVEEGNCPECEYNNELGGSEALKLHLIKIHYHDELKAKYSSEYSSDKNTCPVCSTTVCNFGILTKYLNHIVTEHYTVQDILNLKKTGETQDSSNEEKCKETAQSTPSSSSKLPRKKQTASKSGGGGGGRLKVRSPLSINSDVKEDYL